MQLNQESALHLQQLVTGADLLKKKIVFYPQSQQDTADTLRPFAQEERLKSEHHLILQA